MGKSAAKIRRNQARAAARGETYTPPPPTKKATEGHSVGDEETHKTKLAAAETLMKKIAELEKNPDNLNSKDRRSAKRKAEAIAAEEAGCHLDDLLKWHAQYRKMHKKSKGNKNKSTNNCIPKEDEAKLISAKKLKETLEQLESDTAINSKERRSAKRKAEAIALEETGYESAELLRWYETVHPAQNEIKKHTPYILFVGQLAYTTTSEMLFEHFKTMLGKEIITNETMKVRLLTDSKSKKSKGMAFVELSTPEIMYECLKMHLTHLDGRRINVERSSGGGAAAKKSKISMYREKQSSFISDTMDKIINNHIDNGDIGQDELDAGVIALCKRHSAVVVEQALKEYVEEKKLRRERKEKLGEKEEEELRNPSAFLTHMIGRVAEEGIGGGAVTKIGQGRGAEDASGSNRGKRQRNGSGNDDTRGDSVLENSGVDMSISHAASESTKNMSRIFPSMQRGRGRGRGRGYM